MQVVFRTDKIMVAEILSTSMPSENVVSVAYRHRLSCVQPTLQDIHDTTQTSPTHEMIWKSSLFVPITQSSKLNTKLRRQGRKVEEDLKFSQFSLSNVSPLKESGYIGMKMEPPSINPCTKDDRQRIGQRGHHCQAFNRIIPFLVSIVCNKSMMFPSTTASSATRCQRWLQSHANPMYLV